MKEIRNQNTTVLESILPRAAHTYFNWIKINKDLSLLIIDYGHNENFSPISHTKLELVEHGSSHSLPSYKATHDSFPTP
jgi:hypothetical protein